MKSHRFVVQNIIIYLETVNNTKLFRYFIGNKYNPYGFQIAIEYYTLHIFTTILIQYL